MFPNQSCGAIYQSLFQLICLLAQSRLLAGTRKATWSFWPGRRSLILVPRHPRRKMVCSLLQSQYPCLFLLSHILFCFVKSSQLYFSNLELINNYNWPVRIKYRYQTSCKIFVMLLIILTNMKNKFKLFTNRVLNWILGIIGILILFRYSCKSSDMEICRFKWRQG